MDFEDGSLDDLTRPPPRRRFFTARRLVLGRQRTTQGPVPTSGDDGDAGLTNPDGQPAPEDFLPTPKPPRGPLGRAPALGYARPALTCWALFFAASLWHWQGAKISPVIVSHDALFVDQQWWRLLTALFAHSNMAHLAANSPLFLIFGWFLHAYFGWRAFPLAAIAVGLLSNLATVSINGGRQGLLGASGMLYGMVALWLVFYIRHDRDLSPTMRTFRAIGVSLVLLFPTSFQAETSYTAHATGFAIGLTLGLIVLPWIRVTGDSTSPLSGPAIH